MTKQLDCNSGRRGLPPGSLVFVGALTVRKVEVLLAAPDSDTLRSAPVFDWDQVKKDRSAEPTLGMKLDAK